MKVAIQGIDAKIELKNKGIELRIRDSSDKQLGDLVITRSKLVWCKGRTKRENGIEVSWPKFIDWMSSQV